MTRCRGAATVADDVDMPHLAVGLEDYFDNLLHGISRISARTLLTSLMWSSNASVMEGLAMTLKS